MVNADDPHAELLGAVNLDAVRVAFAMNAPAEVSGKIEDHNRQGSRFLLRGFDREASVNLRLPGESAISHALGAAALAWARGIDLAAVVAGLESVTSLPGRLDVIDEGQAFDVRIDEARHPAALREAISTLNAITPGRVHCVFGDEGRPGDPDAGRTRRALAATAESLADRLTITTNNPRTEDPDRILDEILAGFCRPGRVRVEADRRVAIESALAVAGPDDAVLIAGKGRQSFQIFEGHAIPFDDAAVAREWLRSHKAGVRRTSA